MVQKDSYNRQQGLEPERHSDPEVPNGAQLANWKDKRKTWHQSYSACEEQGPLPSNTKACSKKMAQIIFETFSTPAISINQGGAIPVTHFYHWHHYILQQQGHPHCPSKSASLHPTPSCVWTWLAGDLIDYLIKILTPRGYSLATMPE